MTTRERVIREAEAWLGTPFHHRAAVKGAGVDCAQFLIEVYSRAGLVPRIDVGHYPPDWHLSRDDSRFATWVDAYALPTGEPKKGDIALFRFGRTFSHGAIVVDWPTRVIHSFFRQGVVYSSAQDAELVGRPVVFWTLWNESTGRSYR